MEMQTSTQSNVPQKTGGENSLIDIKHQTFLSVTWWRWLFYSLVLLLLVITSSFLYQWHSEKKELERWERFYTIESATWEIFKKIDSREPPADLPKVFGQSIEGLKDLLKEKNRGDTANFSALLLSEIYLKLGQPEKSIEALQNVQTDHPHEMALLMKNRELNLLLDLKKWDEVLSKSDLVLKMDSEKLVTPDVYMIRAIVFHQQGMNDAAKTELKRIQDLKLPENSLVGKRAEKLLKLWQKEVPTSQ